MTPEYRTIDGKIYILKPKTTAYALHEIFPEYEKPMDADDFINYVSSHIEQKIQDFRKINDITDDPISLVMEYDRYEDGYGDEDRLVIIGYELETEAQRERRVERDRKRQEREKLQKQKKWERNRAKEYNEYERLKKKFEGK